jgi:hypothetical protein
VYTFGAATGGGLTGLSLASGGQLVTHGDTRIAAVAWVAVGIVVLIAALVESSGGIGQLPESKWRVPERWLHWRSRIALGGMFGFLMGMGWLTQLRHAVAYGLAAILFLPQHRRMAWWSGRSMVHPVD